MKKFINLLSDELRRARVFYAVVLGLVVVSQLVIAGLLVADYNAHLEQNNYIHLVDFFDGNGIYYALVMVALMILIIYSAYTWIREWQGGSSFIIRLLTLPGNRFSIVLAKLASLLLMVGGVLFTQLIMLWLINFLATSFMNPDSFSSFPWYYMLAQIMPTTYFFMPMSAASAAILYGVLVWMILTVFLTVLIYLQIQTTSKIKAFSIAFNVLFINLLLFIGMFFSTTSFNLTGTERLISVALFIVLAIGLNTFSLYRKINSRPPSQAKEVAS